MPELDVDHTEATFRSTSSAAGVSHVRPDDGVVLIEHNIREVARICQSTFQNNGRRLVDGRAGEVTASPEFRRAYLGGKAA